MHKFVDYNALILIFDFCQQIHHRLKNQELKNFDLLLQSFILCGFFSKMVRLNTIYINYCHTIVPYCTIKTKISFPPKY